MRQFTTSTKLFLQMRSKPLHLKKDVATISSFYDATHLHDPVEQN